jgi:hypothetical protein
MKIINVNGIKHGDNISLENTALEASSFEVGDKVQEDYGYPGDPVTHYEVVSYERLLMLAKHTWIKGFPQKYIPLKRLNPTPEQDAFNGIHPDHLRKI